MKTTEEKEAVGCFVLLVMAIIIPIFWFCFFTYEISRADRLVRNKESAIDAMPVSGITWESLVPVFYHNSEDVHPTPEQVDRNLVQDLTEWELREGLAHGFDDRWQEKVWARIKGKKIRWTGVVKEETHENSDCNHHQVDWDCIDLNMQPGSSNRYMIQVRLIFRWFGHHPRPSVGDTVRFTGTLLRGVEAYPTIIVDNGAIEQ